MLPIRDHNPARTTPWVTLGLIGLNVLVFLWELSLVSQGPDVFQASLERHGVVPQRLLAEFGPGQATTVFSSMFLHGGLIHLGGNMLYLWIFGNNIEDTLGHLAFLLFYLLSGIGAASLQVAVDPSSTITLVGASGAIAGVLGAYLVLFPRAVVDTLVFLGYFIRIIRVPAVIVLGFWIVIQLFQGAASLGVETTGGVAWFAHVGGFVVGLVLIFLLPRRGATGHPGRFS